MNSEKNANDGDFKPELQAKDVASILMVSESAVHNLVRDKRIEHLRIGGSLRFTRDGVRRYLTSVTICQKPNDGESEPSFYPFVFVNLNKSVEWNLGAHEQLFMAVVSEMSSYDVGVPLLLVRHTCEAVFGTFSIDQVIESMKLKGLVSTRVNTWTEMIGLTQIGLEWNQRKGDTA